MSDGKFRSPIGSQVVVFIVTLLAVTVSLAACSEKPQSLADYIAKICAAPFRTATAEEAPYLAENVSAMTKMMIDMGIGPSGDVDRDFVSMMTPHHQGAIEMAQAELRYGHQRTAQAHGAGNHRYSETGDRGDAAGAWSAVTAVCIVAEPDAARRSDRFEIHLSHESSQGAMT